MTHDDMKREIRGSIGKAKYMSFTAAGRISTLSRLITGYSQRKGQGISSVSADQVATNLDSDIERYYGRELSFEEVVLAIDWGMHRVFGEFSGMNVDRLCEFVRCYSQCPERDEVKRELASQDAKLLRQSSKPDTGRKNWDAMLGEFMELCRVWKERGEVEAAKPAHEILLPSARRTLTGMCYEWLKTVGQVGYDKGTLDSEDEAKAIAARRIAKEKHAPGICEHVVSESVESPEKSLAFSIMMQVYLATKQREGADMDAIIRDIESTPEDERRFYG